MEIRPFSARAIVAPRRSQGIPGSACGLRRKLSQLSEPGETGDSGEVTFAETLEPCLDCFVGNTAMEEDPWEPVFSQVRLVGGGRPIREGGGVHCETLVMLSCVSLRLDSLEMTRSVEYEDMTQPSLNESKSPSRKQRIFIVRMAIDSGKR